MTALPTNAILIGLAGGFGAAARLGVYLVLERGRAWQPWAILLFINWTGSLAIGFLATVISSFQPGAREALAGVMLTGFLGGFTTFSSFAIESAEGFQSNRARGAAAFIGLSIAGGVALAWLGQRLAT